MTSPRQIDSVTIYSRNEHFQAQCKRKYPDFEYILGDIRDTAKLELVAKYQDTVINCAAFKYVPEAEANVSQCLDINVGGVRSLLDACYNSRRCTTVVGISTDKAVEPINMYGFTKAIGERLYCEMAKYLAWDERIKFVQTRYGNVIGSTGSVVPMLKDMHRTKGYVSLTDPEMTRFWLSIEEAVDLVLYAVEHLNSGEIIVPQLRAAKLSTIVKAVVPEALVRVTGLRPGEKRHEKLMTTAEGLKARRAKMNDTHLYILDPYAVAVPEPECKELSSHDPIEWITTSEFAALTADAELV